MKTRARVCVGVCVRACVHTCVCVCVKVARTHSPVNVCCEQNTSIVLWNYNQHYQHFSCQTLLNSESSLTLS